MNVKTWLLKDGDEPINMVLQDQILPELKENEVLIENCFLGLNPVDWKFIKSEESHWDTDRFPGLGASGIVKDRGENISIDLGTRVCYVADSKDSTAFSTHSIVSAEKCITIPETITDIMAAAFAYPGLKVLNAYHKKSDLGNKKVLINGANGSVGFLLSQLLISTGAEVYIAAETVYHEEYEQLGVFKVIDYRNNRWKDELKEELSGDYFSAIFDSSNVTNDGSFIDLVENKEDVICIDGEITGTHSLTSPAEDYFNFTEEASALLAAIGRDQMKLRPVIRGNFVQLNWYLQEMRDQQYFPEKLVAGYDERLELAITFETITAKN